ncbi:NADH oxidase [Nocardia farcinica]|uniref:NADH oxidase n=1 Tax=Nocardia farcinica TaxID=37329 RepID=A0A449GZR3_NOCFR|nr:NADH oxidase [Nocardia farcinica]
MCSSVTSYPLLFSPLDVGPVRVRNRIVQTTHTKGYGADGTDSQRTIDYFVERAKGGCGLLFTDAHLVHPTSTVGMTRKTWGFLPRTREIDRRLTDAVHQHGAKVFTQLVHNGLNASADAADDLRVTWGPSAVKSPLYGETPKEMEAQDIQEVIEWWARSAENCREAGFDGVEIHVGHGYLLHQFWSPLYNHRTDAYGGSWDNRTRLTREVIAEIRRRTGDDWAVGVRLTATDHVPGGISVADAARFAAELECDGQTDFINVTAGDYFDFSLQNRASDFPDGYNVEAAGTIKDALSQLPVFVVGGINDPAHAESVLAAGRADAVAMTRAILADPELPNKAREGRESEIVRCIRGNQGCMSRLLKGFPAGCTVNPAAGRERKLGAGTLRAATTPGRWLVIGAGPAGLRASTTLARRGHRVELAERGSRVGGQVNLILRTPGRSTFSRVIDDLERAAHRAGVTICCEREVTVDQVVAGGYDGVVVATGARPSRSGYSVANPTATGVPGLESAHVLTVWDVLGDGVAGSQVMVLDDEGSRYSAGAVEVLLDRGHQVELVTPLPSLFPATALTLDMSPLYQRILGKGLTYRLNAWAARVDGTAVDLVELYTGAVHTRLDIDTIVLATGRVAADELYLELKQTVPNVHRIGDCVAPRKIDHAIYEGELAGRELWDTDQRYIYDGDLERARLGSPETGMPY